MKQWVLFVTLLAAWFGAGQVWMTQVSWKLWAFVGSPEFPAYHRAWWSGIQPVVFPLAGITLIGSIALLWIRPAAVPAWMVWAGLALQAALWLPTAIWWGPGNARLNAVHLADGALDPLYLRLLVSNWARVAVVNASAVLLSWMSAVSIFGASGSV
jgi:hypothetical protein